MLARFSFTPEKPHILQTNFLVLFFDRMVFSSIISRPFEFYILGRLLLPVNMEQMSFESDPAYQVKNEL